MKVLIVQSKHELGRVWQRHLARQGCEVVLASNEDEAICDLRKRSVDVVVLDLVLEGGGAFSVADFAAYRHPEAKVIFVTNTRFFSDGSIFQHITNAAAFLPTETSLEDLSAVVGHHCPRPKAAAG
ncbi:MAG: DNA-binding NtrC family response regulator [Halocynthiibacter sp.]|jgi:DNA-binding NtrC family response regulator